MSIVVIALGILTLACASAPSPKPVAIDPSNPAAQEAPASNRTTVSLAAPTAGSPPAFDESGHPHQGGDAPTAPAQEAMPTKSAPQGEGATPPHVHGKDAGHAKVPVIYTCPMHPEISSPTPGKCPKCGMTLVPKKSGVSGQD